MPTATCGVCAAASWPSCGRSSSQPPGPPSRPRGDPPDLAVVLVRHDHERSGPVLPHVADALATVGEQPFLTDHALAVHDEAHELPLLQRPDEEVAFPGGEGIARVPLR